MVEDFIKEAIKETLKIDYIYSKPIEDFTIEQLSQLSEMAEQNNLMLTLRAEHSNFHQGTLVNLIKRESAAKLLKWL